MIRECLMYALVIVVAYKLFLVGVFLDLYKKVRTARRAWTRKKEFDFQKMVESEREGDMIIFKTGIYLRRPEIREDLVLRKKYLIALLDLHDFLLTFYIKFENTIYSKIDIDEWDEDLFDRRLKYQLGLSRKSYFYHMRSVWRKNNTKRRGAS